MLDTYLKTMTHRLGRVLTTNRRDSKGNKAMPKEKITTEAPRQLNLEAKATVSLEAKAAEGDGPPPLPRFEMIANTGAPMNLGGWKYPVVLDLAGVVIPSQQRPIRYGHDASQGVGHTESIAV